MSANKAAADEKPNWKLLVELFSVITGMSFVLSALVHQLLFFTWGLDFTAVASVEDVVMGGLRLLIIMLVVVVLWSLTITAFVLQDQEGDRPTRIASWVRLSLELALTAALVWAAFYITEDEFSHPFAVLIGISILIWITLICIRILTSNIPFSEVFSYAKAKWRRILLFSAVFSTFYLVLLYSVSVSPNLMLYTRSNLPPVCRSIVEDAQKIDWIGSRAIVIRCSAGQNRWHRYVIMHPDEPTVLAVPAE